MKRIYYYIASMMAVSLLVGCSKPVVEESTEPSSSLALDSLPTQEVIDAVASYRKEHQQAIDSAEYVYTVHFNEQKQSYVIEVGENHTDHITHILKYIYNPLTQEILQENPN